VALTDGQIREHGLTSAREAGTPAALAEAGRALAAAV
jgi:hypothetical protein